MSESCGNPNVESEALMPRKVKFDKSRTCIKCKANQGRLVIRHAVYCKECFGPLIASKFRHCLEPYINNSAAGPRRVALRPSGDLLVGFSGGLGSTVLLDLVHRTYLSSTEIKVYKGGKAHPRNDRVWKKVRVCHVQISDAFPGMEDHSDKVQETVGRYPDLEFVSLRIQDAFDPSWWQKVTGRRSPPEHAFDVDLTNEDLPFASSSTSDSSPLSALHTYLRSLPTPTAVQSTLATLTRLLLLYTAHSTGSSHLVLGTSLTSLSINLISSISQGGGFVVPQAAKEEWSPSHNTNRSEDDAKWRGEVHVIRPLRDVGTKECTAWAWWNQLSVVGKQKYHAPRQTIGDLTKDFIVGLEKDFPSTVSTIAKTVAKLAPKGQAGEKCVICELPTQRSVQEWKVRTSIRSFTDPHPTTADEAAHRLSSSLCYSCHTTLTSRSSRTAAPSKTLISPIASPLVPLPTWSAAHMAEPANRTGLLGSSGIDSVRHRDNEVWTRKKLESADMEAVLGEFMLDV